MPAEEVCGLSLCCVYLLKLLRTTTDAPLKAMYALP